MTDTPSLVDEVVSPPSDRVGGTTTSMPPASASASDAANQLPSLLAHTHINDSHVLSRRSADTPQKEHVPLPAGSEMVNTRDNVSHAPYPPDSSIDVGMFLKGEELPLDSPWRMTEMWRKVVEAHEIIGTRVNAVPPTDLAYASAFMDHDIVRSRLPDLRPMLNAQFPKDPRRATAIRRHITVLTWLYGEEMHIGHLRTLRAQGGLGDHCSPMSPSAANASPTQMCCRISSSRGSYSEQGVRNVDVGRWDFRRRL